MRESTWSAVVGSNVAHSVVRVAEGGEDLEGSAAFCQFDSISLFSYVSISSYSSDVRLTRF